MEKRPTFSDNYQHVSNFKGVVIDPEHERFGEVVGILSHDWRESGDFS